MYIGQNIYHCIFVDSSFTEILDDLSGWYFLESPPFFLWSRISWSYSLENKNMVDFHFLTGATGIDQDNNSISMDWCPQRRSHHKHQRSRRWLVSLTGSVRELAKKMLEIMAPSLPNPPTVKTAPRRVVAIRSNSRTRASSTIVDVHVDSCVCIHTLTWLIMIM